MKGWELSSLRRLRWLRALGCRWWLVLDPRTCWADGQLLLLSELRGEAIGRRKQGGGCEGDARASRATDLTSDSAMNLASCRDLVPGGQVQAKKMSEGLVQLQSRGAKAMYRPTPSKGVKAGLGPRLLSSRAFFPPPLQTQDVRGQT